MATAYYLAFDGYGYFSEGAQPELSRNALISSDYVYTPDGTSIEIPFFTEDDIEITYTVNGSATTVDLASDFDNTAASAVKYVTFAPNTNNSPYVISVYNNGQTSLLKSINLVPVCEPKYTPLKCQFINKYGVIQAAYFFLRSAELLQIEDGVFRKNIISSSATYDVSEGQTQRFDVRSQTTLSVNTGYVDEDFNKTIEEMFLSENCWITYEGSTLSVVPKTKQLEYKTHLNNKLINYTIQFDFASETINAVR